MLTRILAVVIGSGLAAVAWRALDRYRQQRRAEDRQQSDRAQLRRWEDEGGRIAPASAPR